MKKLFTILGFLIFSLAVYPQSDTLALWSFPTDNLSDTMANAASELNLDKYIYTEGGTSAISLKNGAITKAAQASGWDNGMDLKSWQIQLNTIGFTDLMISSKQTAGGSDPGPRDFQLQFKVGAEGIWTDVDGGVITVANDWETGVLDQLILPFECEDQEFLFIRWVMTSNIDINGVELIESGKGKIDDILITGTGSSSINEFQNYSIQIFPNPFVEFINILSEKIISKVQLIDQYGMLQDELETNNKEIQMNLSKLNPGFYFLVVFSSEQEFPIIQKIIKQ